MRVGIMGGTFDPIHKGHLMLGEYAYQNFELDEVWFMPNGKPPHKAINSIGSSVTHRLNMVSLAVKEIPYFRLETYEADQDCTSYSYETMENLKKSHPDEEFFFIIGADSLFSIEHWMEPERLFKTCTVLAAYRDEINTKERMDGQISYLRSKYQASIELLLTPLLSISSQDIRQKIRQREADLNQLLTREVIDYINEYDLYEEG